MKENYPIVDSVEKLEAALARVREAQRKFATYTQEQVDKIFKAAAIAANKARIPLAKMAVEETGMASPKTRSSRTTTRPNISITRTRTPKLRRHRRGYGIRAQEGSGTARRRRRGHPDDQPDVHRDIQDAHLP